MTEQELREKIARIIENDHCIRADYSDCEGCEYKNCFSCKPYRLADALIAAGIGYVSEYKEKLKLHRVFVRKEGGDIKVLYGNKEVDEIVKERDEYKHRTEVAERAVYNLAYGEWQREGARRAICEKYAPSTARDYLDRAEKELAEEMKDEGEN